MAIGIVVLTKSPKDGTDAVLYNIVPSASAITYDVNTESSSPSFVTVKLKKTVGSVVTYPSVLPDGYKIWYKLDSDSGYAQVSNNGYVYQDGWGVGNQIDVYLTNDGIYPNANKTNVIYSVEIPFVSTGSNGASGADGSDGWSVSLSPSNVAIADKDDGTVDLSTAYSTIIAKYGSSSATVTGNGAPSVVNCSISLLNGVVSILSVFLKTITYTYEGVQYTAQAYYPSGYALIPIKVTYGSKSVELILRLDFTVSAYIGNKINDFKITKIITDNGTIKAQVTEISQKADSVAITASQNKQSINNEISRAESAEASIKVTANKICLSVSDSSMTTQFNTDYTGVNVTDITGDSGYRYQNSIFVQDQGNPTDHIVVLGANVSGLVIGKRYKMHFLINYHSGDGPICSFAGSSASGENVAIGGPTGADEIGSYNKVGDYYDIDCYFVANSTSMACGFKIVLNDDNVYLDITIVGLTIGVDIDTRLLDTNIDLENKNITATTDHFFIRDNSGNVNTVFETVGGKPVMKSQYIQTQDLDVSGTFSERYSFVNRGTLNVINFSTLNNVAVNRGIDTTPAVIVLPMFAAYAGGNFSTAAFQKAGTNISIQNSYNVNMKNWKEAATLLNGSGKALLRYQLAASAVIVVSDPRVIAHNNYTGSVPNIYANGSGNANDSVEYRKGRMFCNGKSARIAMILPGQTLRLQSGIETYNGTSYLVWYVVNASEYTSINKGLQIVGANSIFGSANAGTLAFHATNTYSNWGEGGTYDTDFLIAPKELDAEIVAGYGSEDPCIVLDCSDTESDTLFYVTER